MLLALGVPIPVVMSLYFGEAHLGAEGYFIVGFTLFGMLVTSGTVAAVLAGWLVDRRTPEGRRPFLILMIVLGAVHLAGIVAIIYAVARAGANAGIAVALIVPVVLFTAGLCAGAEAVGRADARRDALLPPVSTTPSAVRPSQLRRALFIMLAAFAAVAIVALTLVLVTADVDGSEDAAYMMAGCLHAIAFAFFAADIVAITFQFSVVGELKTLFRGSHAAQKQLYRVVMKGRNEPLDAEGLVTAREYGRLQIQSLSFNLASSLTLFAALGTMQAGSLLTDTDGDLARAHIAFIAFVIAASVFGVLFIGRSIRRIQRFLAANPV